MKTSIGLCGATGKTPELQIGQVKTVDYTQKASVEITGTRENPILNFNIPKGKDGAKLIVREYFNGDIQILNNLNELPEDTNSDSYGKTVMSVNGIKQLLEKINDVLTKANANTNAIGSLTSTVQGNKSDIETKLNNFKSDTDTRVQSINQTISELEQTIETKLNEELTKQVKALQDENKKLNDMLFENSLKERFEGSESSISDTSNGVAVIETIKGQTIVTDAPTEENPNYKLIESVGDKENNKISILSRNKNLVPFFDDERWLKTNITGMTIEQDKIYGIPQTTGYNLLYKVYLKANKTYTTLATGQGSNLRLRVTDADNKNIVKTNVLNTSFTINDDGYYNLKLENNGNTSEYSLIEKLIVQEGSNARYEQPKEDKKEISVSLDGGLKSLPNGVADTIEQRQDGFYLVQRIDKVIVNGSENWNIDGGFTNQSQKVMRFSCQVKNASTSLGGTGDKILCAELPIVINENGDILPKIWCSWQNFIYIDIDPNKLNISFANDNKDTKINKFKTWLHDNPVTVYYLLATAIETKLDIDNLKLKSYKDLTYVTSENNIKPILTGQATKDITTVIKNLQSKGAN